MKKYEYVTLKLRNNPAGSAYSEEHRKIIDEYAEKGYSYVGYIPVWQGASGKILSMDLIFEKIVNKK